MSENLDIHAFVDGELGDEAAAALLARIQSDPRLAAEVAAIRQLKSVAASCGGGLTCDETWSRCVSRMNEIDRAARTERFVGRYAWGLCALVFLALVSGGLYSRHRDAGSIYAADVARVANAGTAQTTVAGNEHLTGWLSGLFGRAPVQAPPSELRVLAMTRTELEGRRVARIEMADAAGPVVLIIVEGATGVPGLTRSDGTFQHGRLDCVNSVGWTRNGATLLLVGDRPHARLEAIASQIQVR
jgi:anti-sigma factor RsiW